MFVIAIALIIFGGYGLLSQLAGIIHDGEGQTDVTLFAMLFLLLGISGYHYFC